MTIEMLANAFIQNTLSMLDRVKDSITVWDWDGTLTKFKYAEKSLLPCRDDEIYEYSKAHNIYADAKILAVMQYIISQLPKERVFILTRTEMTLIDKKNESILKHFDVLPENIYHVQDAHRKLEVLDMLHTRFGEDLIFVEDTFKTILNAEEAMPFVHGIHISEFLV